MNMDIVAAIWDRIPRKLKYLALTLALYAMKTKWPGIPLPDPDHLEVLAGGGLIGGHVLTDVASSLGAFRAMAKGGA